jgi:uncharacterized protein (TIGR03118 family)
MLVPAGAQADPNYIQTNLVSDLSTVGAAIVDPNLKNPWGVSHSATSPFWVSNQGTNTSTLYSDANGIPAKVGTFVNIPTTGTGPQGPTGQVNNGDASSFVLNNGTAASFIFANLNGTISAWNGGLGMPGPAQVVVPRAPGRSTPA